MSKDLTESASALFLMKLAPIFIYPVGLVIVLSAAGLIIACLGHHGLALALIGVGWGWLWVASMPVFADWAISTLESQYPAQPIEEQPSADVAIVLGGAVGQPAPPRVEANLNKAFDRVIQAMRLYHAKRIKRVLIAGGGNVPWRPRVVSEAEIICSFLVEWGNVPAEAIEIATQSRNTYENAIEIKELWENRYFDSALLITSAAHMPRAIAVFQKAGLPVIASTTDIEALAGVPMTAFRWLPDASALAMTTNAAKEWLGYWAYLVRGYL